MITLRNRKKIEDHNWQYDHFPCVLRRGIRKSHPFSPLTSRFCCTGSGHFSITIGYRKIIFRKEWAIAMVSTIFYVFWGEEFENRISFHPSRLDFAILDKSFFGQKFFGQFFVYLHSSSFDIALCPSVPLTISSFFQIIFLTVFNFLSTPRKKTTLLWYCGAAPTFFLTFF